MKTIYFIRHGETLYNRRWIHQHALVPLSDKGKQQAKKVARRFKHRDIDIIIASDTKRTQETAEEIKKTTKVDIEYEPVLREYRRASSVTGSSYFTPKSLLSVGLTLLHANDPDYRYEDAESVSIFQQRCRDGLQMILDREEEHIIVVSHRVYISGMLIALENDCKATTKHFMRLLLGSQHMHNTGVTKLVWKPTKGGKWFLEYVDDYSHLKHRA